jgi:hypothetical protein
MPQTFRIVDFFVTANNRPTPDQEQALVYGVTHSRALADEALLQIIEALRVEATSPNRDVAATNLPFDFTAHVEANHDRTMRAMIGGHSNQQVFNSISNAYL